MLNPAIVILSVLFFTSTILCIAMTLAWRHFGRQRHALSWALAFGGGALQWIINATGVLVWPGSPIPPIVASILVIATSSLVAIGARQRAWRDDKYGAFLVGGLLASAAIVLVYAVMPHLGLRGAIPNIYAAAMMPVAAAAILPEHRKPQAPETAFFVMLLVFGGYQLVLGFSGLAIGPQANPEGLERYRAILGIGLPPVYVGTGIAALFLLAGDLAESVRALVTRDALTGSLNRRGIEQAATVAMANARRHGRPLSVVMGDLDRFKSVNDRFGHAAGDGALIAFADHVQASVREEDSFGRMGGDEFCLVLSDATASEAALAVERIRSDLAQLAISGMDGVALTASFGVADFVSGDVTFGDLLRRADLALYDSKIGGRGRVTVAERPA